MKKRKILIATCSILVVLAVVIGIVLWRNVDVKAKYADANAKILGEFTAKTASELLNEEKENICYSPASLISALIMSAELTDEEAAQEICKAFDVKDVDELEEVYSQMLDKIQVSEKTELNLGNSLWVDANIIKDSDTQIISNCQEKLGCEIFERNGINGREINSWVSKLTNGMINEVVDENVDSPVILANALYFKSNWADSFKDVKDDAFYLEDGETIEVPYIRCKEETMRYVEDKDYTMVKVSLEDGDMYFVLPTKNKSLSEVITEKNLNEFMALSTNDKMDRGVVTISIPNFEYDYDSGNEIESVIKKFGINKVFDVEQWLIGDCTELDTVKIGQKTSVAVDKNGIEAAAVTKVEVAYIGKEKEKEEELVITFDRPFMYILMKEGVPLFIGTVYNPAE